MAYSKILLTSILLIFGTSFVQSEEIESSKSTIISHWIRGQSVDILQPEGIILHTLHTKEATYKIIESNGNDTEIKAIAFYDGIKGNVWVGLHSDFYLEHNSAVIGINVSRGFIQWNENMATKDFEKNIDFQTNEFEKSLTKGSVKELLKSKTQETSLIRSVNFLLRSELLPPIVKKISLTDEELELHLESSSGKLVYEATVWINLDSKKITKVIEGKREQVEDVSSVDIQ